MAKKRVVEKKTVRVAKEAKVIERPSNFTRAEAVAETLREIILSGKDSFPKAELIEKADKLYASVKGKKENPYEATWLSRVAIGTAKGFGLLEDSRDSVFVTKRGKVYFKALAKEAVKKAS